MSKFPTNTTEVILKAIKNLIKSKKILIYVQEPGC